MRLKALVPGVFRYIRYRSPSSPSQLRCHSFAGLQVETCYAFSAGYNATNDLERLKQLEAVVQSLEGEQSVLVASAFSHMLTLGNVAGES